MSTVIFTIKVMIIKNKRMNTKNKNTASNMCGDKNNNNNNNSSSNNNNNNRDYKNMNNHNDNNSNNKN